MLDLARSARRVRAIKRADSDLSIVQRVFEFYEPETGTALFQRIEWVEGDILDVISLEESMNGAHEVYHCAALVSFDTKDDAELMRINVDGTANVVNAAIGANVASLCHVSSTGAVGKKRKNEEIDERAPWHSSKKTSAYAESKHFAEREIWRGSQEGLNVVIVNPSVIVGPGDWGRSSGAIFKKIWTGFKFYTTGVNGFVDARDVSKAMLELMDKGLFNERYLVVSENLSYKQFFDLVAWGLEKPAATIHANRIMTSLVWRLQKVLSKLTGKRPTFTKHNARSTHSRHFYSNKKLRSALGMELIPVRSAVENAGTFFKRTTKN